jgi:hypothetical protein
MVPTDQFRVAPQPPEVAIAPTSLMTFKVDQSAGDAEQALVYQKAGQISKVTIELSPVYFSDESKWDQGKYYLAAPPPVVWREVAPAEFASGNTASQP